jgi:hypothetical protein
MENHEDPDDQGEDISGICSRRIDNDHEEVDDIGNVLIDNIDNEEELNLLLNGKKETKMEMVLKCKMNELQKICNSLANTNCQLSEKLTLLSEEKEGNKKDETFFDEYS